MNNETTDQAEAGKNEKVMRTMRRLWLVLIAVFAAVILYHLYRWSQGKSNFTNLLTPLAMIFVGLGTILAPRSRALQMIFIALGAVTAVAAIVLLILY